MQSWVNKENIFETDIFCTKIVETIPILFHFGISLFSITKLQCDPTLDSLHQVFGYIFFFLLSPEANDITFWMRNFHWMFKTYEILNMYFIFVPKASNGKARKQRTIGHNAGKTKWYSFSFSFAFVVDLFLLNYLLYVMI